MSVAIWHDVECGAYREDLPLWRRLAGEHGDPVLDIGAGTGRVALDLLRLGFRVTALDSEGSLLAVLSERAQELPVSTVEADAREFALGARFPLILVPMQTVQLLGGRLGRASFLHCAREHLLPGGVLAIAIAEELEPFEVSAGDPYPLPDIRELDGVVYASRPVAIRSQPDGFVLERLRETVTSTGARTIREDVIKLDRVTATELEREAVAAGLLPAARAVVAATDEYVASNVVMLRG
jgi:SAM-dependent methyltransferase